MREGSQRYQLSTGGLKKGFFREFVLKVLDILSASIVFNHTVKYK
jgi:hypothetical protein